MVADGGGGGTVVSENDLSANRQISNGTILICFGTNVFINVIFYSSD
jgi:hypothetical protein